MKKREELNKLVVKTLETNPSPQPALFIFQQVKSIDVGVVRDIHTLKSFAKIINQFEEVKSVVVKKGEAKFYMLRS